MDLHCRYLKIIKRFYQNVSNSMPDPQSFLYKKTVQTNKYLWYHKINLLSSPYSQFRMVGSKVFFIHAMHEKKSSKLICKSLKSRHLFCSLIGVGNTNSESDINRIIEK